MTMEQTEITARIDTGDLIQGWANKKGLRPGVIVSTRLGAKTDLGLVRENNEDKFEFFEPEEPELLAAKGLFYAVADGMGGHASGQIASELALKMIIRNYYTDFSEDIEQSLEAAFKAANAYIYDVGQSIPERSGMGTTCTAAVICEDKLHIAHVGDSRAYMIRSGKIRQLTQDHSWVAEQVQRGAMTEEEAMMSPFRNVITRSLGVTPDVEVDFYQEELKRGDVILMCSDGLSGYVSDAEILEIVSEASPALAALKLIDRANGHGGGDNITALIVSIKSIDRCGSKRKIRRLFDR
ncbi:MAG: Stp1/IreP family PP2C-type Ser/Thr phosphatase [Armatimonadetes bacterium]|nr:Stp1/IreP family PP2C-type Ser/Thr phosphatase [Armatimonadota bacterium]